MPMMFTIGFHCCRHCILEILGMRKVSELYKMYRELPLFQVYIFLLSFYFSLSRESPILVQTLFEALEELCDEDDPGGENLTLPPHLAPAVVHTLNSIRSHCYMSLQMFQNQLES